MFGNYKLKKELETSEKLRTYYAMAPAIALNEVYGSLNTKEVNGKNRIQRYDIALQNLLKTIGDSINDQAYLNDLEKQYKGLISGRIPMKNKKAEKAAAKKTAK